RSLHEKGPEFKIAPEVVAMHVISLAKQGVSDHKTLCTRTLRILSGRSALSPDLRADNAEYLSYLRSSTMLTGKMISNSVALIDEGRALMAQVERQLNHSSRAGLTAQS